MIAAAITIWLLGIPGAYSVTRPSDGRWFRWVEAVLWPLVIPTAVLLLTVAEAYRWRGAQ